MTKNSAVLRESLSALAVIASLVFVGLGIRQNTAAQRSATRQAISDASTDWMMRMAETPDLALAFNTIFGSAESTLTPADSASVQMAMDAALRRMENLYLQQREGVFDEGVLATYGFVGGYFSRPEFHEYWRSGSMRKDVFDPSFIQAFEEANELR